MKYYSEKDIRDIVLSVIKEVKDKDSCTCVATDIANQLVIPVETSARHVHLSKTALEQLFGAGYQLKKKRDLSQPGEFLSEERVKVVTVKGEFSNVAVLGPVRTDTQVELSLTDCRALGISAPVNLSGDLTNAEDVLLIGPNGIYEAKRSAIIAKAHIHMTPQDAKTLGVKNGQTVAVRIRSARPVTLNQVVVRVKDNFSLALHVDFDESNAAAVTSQTDCVIV